MTTKRKVLILGSGGQIGSELVALADTPLNQRNFNSVSLARGQLDVTNHREVVYRLSSEKPDYVINATAYTAVDRAEDEHELCHCINHLAVENLAVACEEIGACLFHISTDYVYPGLGGEPQHEDLNPEPCNVYGWSKLLGERAIELHCTRYFILRTSWVFGCVGANFVKTMIRLAATRESIQVVDDQIGAPTSAAAIADAIFSILSADTTKQSRMFGIYNFSGDKQISWAQFANVVFSRAHALGLIENLPLVNKISSRNYITAAKRSQNSRLNCEKIQSSFGVERDDWQRSLDVVLKKLRTSHGG